MKAIILFGSLLVCVSRCYGQGNIYIGFEGPPILTPGSAVLYNRYDESGISFVPIGANGNFGRVASTPRSFSPDNGTAYLQTGIGSSLQFSFTNGALFSLRSVDLAEYSTVLPDAVTVRFIGYRPDGSTVTRDITTDGIIDGTGPLADFQTFGFGNYPGFSGLSRVEITTVGWSLDNLVVTIPEPGSGLLCLTGGLALWLLRRRKPRQ